ncbi:serine protease [Rhizobium leguminosarum]|uniref:S1 family peptidase n=1 Tax=Rhizobium leguminosarum TaxID=384 RepID=UPI000FF474D1|nr:serine protease [Rhizobium leguminosarum]RWY72347.1 serine protease [Rhizobium leguminosarum]
MLTGTFSTFEYCVVPQLVSMCANSKNIGEAGTVSRAIGLLDNVAKTTTAFFALLSASVLPRRGFNGNRPLKRRGGITKTRAHPTIKPLEIFHKPIALLVFCFSKSCPTLLVVSLVMFALAARELLAAEDPVDPKRLVVMIEATSPVGKPVAGAGLVVGVTADGQALIVTARHVIYSTPEQPNRLAVRYLDKPAQLVPAQLEKADFGTDLDLAVIVAPLPEQLAGLDFANGLPVGRLTDDFAIEEPASLIGQTEAGKWSTTTNAQKITADQGDTVRVQSFEAGPGVSGGIAKDSSDRVIGIALSDDQYVISVLKLSVIETQLRSAGFVFAIIQGPKKDLASDAELELRLRAALSSAQSSALRVAPPNARAVSIVNHLLDQDETLSAFVQKFRSTEAMAWFSRLIESGFDPNRLASLDSGRQRSLLYFALQANNVPMAITLLNKGASPYVYEELWGQENSQPLLMFPLNWLEELSATQDEKAALVRAMIEAGLTVPDIDPPATGYTNEQMDGLKSQAANFATRFGIVIPVQNSIRHPANDTICKRFSEIDNYDWCKDASALPGNLKGLSDGWLAEFTSADLVALLSVVNDTMFVLTYSGWGGTAYPGYGLMEIAKNGDSIVWYRYMGSAFGMGHCEELRGVSNWKPNSYETCWKRQKMIRDQPGGEYHVRGYDSVRYQPN